MLSLTDSRGAAAADDAPVSNTAVDGAAMDDMPAADRFVCFGPVPAIVAISVSVDGRTVQDLRRETAEVLIQQLDGDGDGALNAAEAAALDPLPGDSGRAAAELMADADADDTGTLDAAELAQLLSTALGPDVILQRVEGRSLSDLSLETFLDGNADGRLTAEEYEAGFTRLRRVDFDDDGTLSAAELIAFAKAAETNGEIGRLFLSADAPEAAAQLSRPMPTVTDRWKQRRWSEIDADSNGTVSRAEAAAWLADAGPDLLVQLELAADRGNRVTLEIGGSQLRPVRPARQRRRTRAEASFGEAELEFRVSNANFMAADGRDFLLQQHRIQDADKSGTLNEDEYGGLNPSPGPFAAVDRDGDGLISADDLRQYVEDVQRLAQLQVKLSVEDVSTSLFDRIDSDIDYRLSPREVRQHAEQLKGQGRPQSIRVTAATEVVNFLGQEEMASVATRTLPIQRTLEEGPEWFRKMDRNRDGDLTWREFLGPRAAFDRLDADADGFITASEATASAGR